MAAEASSMRAKSPLDTPSVTFIIFSFKTFMMPLRYSTSEAQETAGPGKTMTVRNKRDTTLERHLISSPPHVSEYLLTLWGMAPRLSRAKFIFLPDGAHLPV